MNEGKPIVVNESTTLDKIIHYFPYFIAPVIIIMLAAYFFNFHSGFGDQGDFGAFGDFFGGILNPMLTFLTILLLLRQLRYQRSELHATVEELRNTAKIHKESIDHSRAVDIFDKTKKEFVQEMSDFEISLGEIFALLAPDGTLTENSYSAKDPYGQETVALSFNNLDKNIKLITTTTLHSNHKDKFYSSVSRALHHTVSKANNALIYASEYQRLGVNRLLYLGPVKGFTEKCHQLEKTICLFDIESEVQPIHSRLLTILHRCYEIIERAEELKT